MKSNLPPKETYAEQLARMVKDIWAHREITATVYFLQEYDPAGDNDDDRWESERIISNSETFATEKAAREYRKTVDPDRSWHKLRIVKQIQYIETKPHRGHMNYNLRD